MSIIVTILEIVLASVFFLVSAVFCFAFISAFIDEIGGNTDGK